MLEYFDATKVRKSVHIIGVGAVGSTVCEILARMGFPKVHIYDFDTVSDHNITNQMFNFEDIGKLKVDAVEEMMKRINPDICVVKHSMGLMEPYTLSGIAILCVDNIDLRRKIVTANRYNTLVDCFLDFRMRLIDAQHYFADARVQFQMDNLLGTMNFTHEEAQEETPRSACNVELNVVYTVRTIVSMGIANLINWLQDKPAKTMILTNMESLEFIAATAREPKKRSTVERMIAAGAKRSHNPMEEGKPIPENSPFY